MGLFGKLQEIRNNLAGKVADILPVMPASNNEFLKYKTIYYCNGVSYNDAIEYLKRFDFRIFKISKQIQYYIDNGYIKQAVGIDNIKFLKVTELKEILRKYGLKVSGKKDELIMRLKDNISEDELLKYVPSDAYLTRTDKGTRLYHELIEQREQEKQALYNETIANVSLSRCEEYDFIRQLLGTERANIAIADWAVHKYNPDYSYVANIHDLFTYRNEDVTEYEVLSEKDCCDKCKRHSGKVYSVSTARIGYNMPPFHDGCRCSTVAFDD